ncbi:MAG: hypothetical protein V3U84_09750 [Thiotrichaceae bacterium]
MSKRIILSLIVVATVVVLLMVMASVFPISSWSSRDERVVADLPWQINAKDEEQTRVLGLVIGSESLAAATENIRKIPEIAVFQNPEGGYLIEAYFSKVKRGPLQGSLAVEVDIEGVDLAGYAKFGTQGKPMPSGKRKFVLSKTGILGANKLRVWKLAYLPGAHYSAIQIQQFFGEPASKVVATNSIENWLYPAKGLIVSYDKEGREVFYYSARQDYNRLLNSVPGTKGKK